MQRNPPNDATFACRKFQLKPLAEFSLNARVLHRKIYRYDRSARARAG